MGSKKVLNNYGSFDVVFKSGKGSILTDINGKKYIDFLAGIAVNSLGHNFKPLVKAVELMKLPLPISVPRKQRLLQTKQAQSLLKTILRQ